MKSKKMIIKLGSTILITSLLLTGCFGGKDKEVDIKTPEVIEEVVVPEEIEKEKVEVEENGSIIGLSGEGDNYSYQINTLGNTVIQTGMHYTIEKLNENTEWEMIDLGLMFTMQIVIIDSENPFSQDIDVSSLEVGKYRVSKDLLDGEGKPLEETGTIEFEILEEGK